MYGDCGGEWVPVDNLVRWSFLVGCRRETQKNARTEVAYCSGERGPVVRVMFVGENDQVVKPEGTVESGRAGR